MQNSFDVRDLQETFSGSAGTSPVHMRSLKFAHNGMCTVNDPKIKFPLMISNRKRRIDKIRSAENQFQQGIRIKKISFLK